MPLPLLRILRFVADVAAASAAAVCAFLMPLLVRAGRRRPIRSPNDQ